MTHRTESTAAAYTAKQAFDKMKDAVAEVFYLAGKEEPSAEAMCKLAFACGMAMGVLQRYAHAEAAGAQQGTGT